MAKSRNRPTASTISSVSPTIPPPPPASSAASTVVAIPLKTHLRADAATNHRASWQTIDEQAGAMSTELCWGLIALSGRWPVTASADELAGLTQRRARLGMAATGHTDPHWLWLYLVEEMPATIPRVRREHVLAHLQEQRWTIQSADEPKTITALPPDDDAAAPVVFRFAKETVGEDVLWFMGKDFRSSLKGGVFDAVAAAAGMVDVGGVLSVGAAGPYYLGAWLCGGDAPAPLRVQAPGRAGELATVIGRAWPDAITQQRAWLGIASRHLDVAITDRTCIAAVRSCIASCAYEALKVVSSWVSLDRLAAADRAERTARLTAELTARHRPAEVTAIRELIQTIQARTDARLAADPDAPVLGLEGLDWRACSAISNHLAGKPFVFRRGDRESPWSHPDIVGFLSVCGDHRSALQHLVAPPPLATDDDTPAESLAELARVAERASGRARLSLPAHYRIHVDLQSSGADGTLTTTTDPTDQRRLRGPRGETDTPVLVGTLAWLGREHAFRFHIGRNRGLTLTEADARWDTSYWRNVRRPDAVLRGALKSFDLAVFGERLSITLPVNIGIAGFDHQERTKSLALGGYYRMRPGAEPMQPNAAKTVPPAAARIMGFDVGVVPLGGWSIVAKTGDGYREEDHGLIGPADPPLDQAVFAPGVTIGALRQGLAFGNAVRLTLRSLARNAQRPDQARKPGPAEHARRALIAHQDEELLATIERLAERTEDTWPVQVAGLIDRVVTAMAERIAATASTSATVKLGTQIYPGKALRVPTLDAVCSEATQAAMRDITDADVRRVGRALLAPVVGILAPMQRLRTARADLATATRMTCADEDQMNAARDHLAKRHGYADEATLWSFVSYGENPALFRHDHQAEGASLATRMLVADLLEDLHAFGRGLAGWTSPPLQRGQLVEPGDARFAWESGYGWMATQAADIRMHVHRVVARRMADLARTRGVDALVVEALDLGTSSRRSTEENSLSRRFAVAEWTAMVTRAADLAGVPIIMGSPLYTTREVAPLGSGGLAALEIGLVVNGEVRRQDGSSLDVHPRVNAARNLAVRALAGNPERGRFAVLTGRMVVGTFAVMRPVDSKGKKYAAWQARLAATLGVAGPADLCWRLDGDVARLVTRPAQLVADGPTDWLAAAGADGQGRRWITQAQYAAIEQAQALAHSRAAR